MISVRKLAWSTLAWNVLVVLWGAVVRATGSGAGCGTSWPTCHGRLIPELEGATAIEFGHRAVSGVALLLVALTAIGVFRTHARGEPARKGAFWSVVAILVESGIGAAIVFYEWVADDASAARVISVPIHLANTFLLLAALTLTAFWASGGGRLTRRRHRWAFLVVGLGMVAVAATGAVTALADTLFPKDGFTVLGVFDVQTSEHLLTRLRAIHPFVAIGVGLLAAVWAWRRFGRAIDGGRAAVRLIAATVLVQIGVGFANVLFLTPTWLTVVHLLLADVLWITWVWLAATVTSEPAPSLPEPSAGRR